MALMGKLRGRRDLPTVPAGVEAHPTWQKHQQQLADLTRVLTSTRALIDALDGERREVTAALSEAQVSDLLGEDTAAASRIAASTRRRAEIEAQLTEARDRMGVQAEAVSRLEARSAGIRESVAAELRGEVDRVYPELSEALAEHFAALVPINRQLIELRNRHGQAPTGAGLNAAIWFDELIPGPLRTKLPLLD
jgi:chromosome segregation ATPase